MNATVVWMILGMGAVTYIPRILPLVALQTEKWPAWSKRLLSRVPYAVLGALIFPGILYIHDALWFGIVGGIVALVVSSIGAPLIIVVGGSITFLAIVQLIL